MTLRERIKSTTMPTCSNAIDVANSMMTMTGVAVTVISDHGL